MPTFRMRDKVNQIVRLGDKVQIADIRNVFMKDGHMIGDALVQVGSRQGVVPVHRVSRGIWHQRDDRRGDVK